MKWFRRISARPPLVQEERNEYPDFSGSDDEAELDQEESPEDDPNPVADPSRCRKRKLDDDDDFMGHGSAEIVYNSSGACPDIASEHNKRVSNHPPKEHILHLPLLIQQLIYSIVLVSEDPYIVLSDGKMVPKPLVYYKIRENNRLVKKELKKHDGTPICRAPGILLVCKQVRELAVPIFYIGNSFKVRISNFYGEGIKEWWQRTEAQRKQAGIESGPLDSNGTMHSVDQYSRNCKPALRDLELTSAALACGTITLHVAYEPNWQNLVTWLNSCIKGNLPKYIPTDLAHNVEGHRLQTVAWLFNITEQYSRFDDQAFDKTIASHRGHLIRDDPGWSIDHVNELDDDDDGMDFFDRAKDDHEMATARDAQLCSVAGSPASSPILTSPSQYQEARETLPSSFLAMERSMKAVDNNEVEDDSDYDMEGGEDTLMDQEEQPGRLVKRQKR